MKSIAILALLTCLAYTANIRSRVNYEYAFQNYVSQFQKVYATSDEFVYRLQVFADNLDKIDQHNAGESSYKLGVNQFADLTKEEFKSSVLSAKLPSRSAKEVYRSNTRAADKVDWVAQGAVTPIKNQGACGSCWAFAATGALESANFIKNKYLVLLSEQQLVDCSTSYGNEGCNGGLMEYAYEYVKDHGICTETDYPYTGKDGKCKTCRTDVKITGYKTLEQNEDALAEAVTNQPVSVGMYADPLQLYFFGVFDGPCKGEMDHGVLIVGYDVEVISNKKYWHVKNSWGKTWGEKGYFKLARGRGGLGICRICEDATIPTL